VHEALRNEIQRFLDGETSISQAQIIEGLIATTFPEEHPAQEIADELAQYSPGGGPFLYSEHRLQTTLRSILETL